MAHFKRVTSTPPIDRSTSNPEGASASTRTNAVIMGRKTWESIPSKFRPLDNRTNVILTRQEDFKTGKEHKKEQESSNDDIIVCPSLERAVEQLKLRKDIGDIYVIGGGQVYQEAIESGLANKVIYTEVDMENQGKEFDTWFPELSEGEWDCKPFPGHECDADASVAHAEEKKEENVEKTGSHVNARKQTVVKKDKKTGVGYQFLEYTRKSTKLQKVEEKNGADAIESTIEEGAHVNPEEMQYLAMCRDIIENGVERGDRTGTGTLSKFGTQMRFSLRDGTLPLLTTKRTFWRGVAEELLWFVQVSAMWPIDFERWYT